jgi:carbon-monoxide dehydrogenase small subunit
MLVKINVNGKMISEDVSPDLLLIDFLRNHNCFSVKRGCETSNCGLCTVLMDDQPILSCSILTVRADGHKIMTLEGLEKEAEPFAYFMANQGAEQCGFCNPGFMVNAIALFREYPNPTDEQILAYLAGNLCRCSGYEGQFRAIKEYLAFKEAQDGEA